MEHLPTSSAETLQRTIGIYDSGIPGPGMITIGAIHGNEPSGVLALQSILARLADHQLSIKGRFAGIIGNLAAFKAGQRYVQCDLNRIWDVPPGSGTLENATGLTHAEAQEQMALWSCIAEHAAMANGEVFVIDLHTTSSPSMPFLLTDDWHQGKAFFSGFPVPKVYGIDRYIPGTLSACLNRDGYTAINFEAGHHDDPMAPGKHEAMLWLALVAAGMVDAAQVPEYAERHTILTGNLPADHSSYEIVHCHSIRPGEYFTMVPGFDNFTPVKAGQVLAQSDGQMVVAPFDAHIFMPLYQQQGSDGFFLVKKTG